MMRRALLCALVGGCSLTLELDPPTVTPVVIDCDGPERCNGLDDDCDTLIDEGTEQACYSGPAGTEGVAGCRGGTAQCVAVPGEGVEVYGPCDGEVLPGVEQCNGRDDDCDGAPDSTDDAPVAQPCYPFDEGEPGVGRCRAGRALCLDAEFGLCEAAVGPRDEASNDQDDDCDGAVDE